MPSNIYNNTIDDAYITNLHKQGPENGYITAFSYVSEYNNL